jgi:hypothetical protein
LFLSLLKSWTASNAPFLVYIMFFGGKERKGEGEDNGALNLAEGFQFRRSLTRWCSVEPFSVNALALRASKHPDPSDPEEHSATERQCQNKPEPKVGLLRSHGRIEPQNGVQIMCRRICGSKAVRDWVMIVYHHEPPCERESKKAEPTLISRCGVLITVVDVLTLTLRH